MFKGLLSRFIRSALLDYFPELRNVIHISSSSGSSMFALPNTNYKTYQNAVWVYRCATIWGASFSGLEMRVYDAEGKINTKNAKVDQILQEPNPDIPSSEFWDSWAVEMALRGYCGLERVDQRGGAVELWLRSADVIQVNPRKGEKHYGRVQNYTINPNTDNAYTLGLDEMCLTKFYNPIDRYVGLSPLEAMQLSARNDYLSTLYHNKIFQNGARPDYVYTSKELLTPSARKKLEEDLKAGHGMDGSSWNVGRGIILPDGVELTPLTFKADDLAWKSLKEFSRDEVCGGYGVPDELAGFGKNTYENFDAAERVFWTHTMLPKIGFRDDRLTHFFRRLGWLLPGHRVRTDLTRIVPLRRVFDPMFSQAIKLFTMGAPFSHINEYLGLGFPRFKGDENSYPFGTQLSFDASGQVIDVSASVGESQQSMRNAEFFRSFIKRVMELEDAKAARSTTSPSA